jgi:hypothetical protein
MSQYRCSRGARRPANSFLSYIAPLLNDAALKKQSVSTFRKLNSVAADIKTDEILAGYADMSDVVGKLVIGTINPTTTTSSGIRMRRILSFPATGAQNKH